MKSLEELLDGWQAGTLSPEELGHLRDLLGEPAAREELLNQWLLEEAIYDTLRPEVAAVEEAKARVSAASQVWVPSLVEPRRRRWFRWLVWREAPISLSRAFAAVGFACLLILGISLYYQKSAVGRLGQVPARATVMRDGRVKPAKPGEAILANDLLRLSLDAPQPLTLTLGAEGTHLEMVPGTEVRVRNPWRGKKLDLSAGTLHAMVAPQPRWRPLRITTPQAVAKVVGTQFSISVTGAVTRLSVLDGAVRLTKTVKGAIESLTELTVRAGQTAAASPNTKLEAALLTGFLSSERWLGPANAPLTEVINKGRPANELGTAAPPKGSVVVERLRGYLIAPATGEFTFWLASLHGGAAAELWLSPDEQPGHKQRLAWVIPAGQQGRAPGARISRNSTFGQGMDSDWRRSPTQKSSPRQLVAGRRYYIEILHQGSGIESLALGWTVPGQANAARPVMVDINSLCPFVPNSPGLIGSP